MDEANSKVVADPRPRSFFDALEVVLSLARDNQPSDHDVDREDVDLRLRLERQRTAADTLEDFLTNYADEIADLDFPNEFPEPDGVWRATVDSDPSVLVEAIKICLDVGEQGALDPKDAEGVDLENEMVIQNRSFDAVRALLCMHGDKLAKVVNIPLGGLLGA